MKKLFSNKPGIVFFLVICFLFCQSFYFIHKINRQESEIVNLKSYINNLEKKTEKSVRQNYVNAQSISWPVVFCGDTLYNDDPVIRASIEREFYALLGNQGQIQLYLKRTQKYFSMIERHLQEASLPEDLKYLATHESALLPGIRSKSHATGLWQFMFATGRHYKLRIDRVIDERLDPVKSTRAAVQFLTDLYKKYHSWPLVMAAYNGGAGRIDRTLRNQNSHNFVDLVLPEETERYYFKIAATKIILSQPERYGFYMEPDDYYQPENYIPVEHKVTKRRESLVNIALNYNLSLAQFRMANPSIKANDLAEGTYTLNIPQDYFVIVSSTSAADDSCQID